MKVCTKEVCLWSVCACVCVYIGREYKLHSDWVHSSCPKLSFDLQISLFHIQPITVCCLNASLINWDAEQRKHIPVLSLLNGCQWRCLALIPISHHLALITHTGNHHHGNCCTCYVWLSRKPGWIMVPLLSCIALHLFVWLTCSTLYYWDVKIAVCSEQTVVDRDRGCERADLCSISYMYVRDNTDDSSFSKFVCLCYTWLKCTCNSVQRLLESALQWWCENNKFGCTKKFHFLTFDSTNSWGKRGNNYSL